MKTRRPVRLPRTTPTYSAEREYLRFLNLYVLKYVDLMRAGLEQDIPTLKDEAAEEIPQPRLDSRNTRLDANIEARIRAMFERVSKQLDEAFSDYLLRRAVRGMINQVNKGSKKNNQKQIKAAYRNKDETPDFEPLMHDKDLNPYFENVIDENVGLIKSIPRAKLPEFKNQLVSMITQDATKTQIAEAITKNFAVTKRKAVMIARDQVGKLNGFLNEYRQQQIGGKRYRWRSSGDSRERPDHRDLNDHIFFWSKPPIVDKRSGRRAHPGKDFQCRCWPEMILDDILD